MENLTIAVRMVCIAIAAVLRVSTFVTVIIIKIMYYISIYVFGAKRVLFKFSRLLTTHCSKNRCDKKK